LHFNCREDSINANRRQQLVYRLNGAEWGPGARSHRKDLFKEKGQIELELLRRHQSGDTLASISRKFYKSPKRWEKILDANKESIRNPGNLKVGQTLIIP